MYSHRYKWSLKNIFLYSHSRKYRSRMCSRKNSSPRIFPAGNLFPFTSARLFLPHPKHIRSTSEPHPSHIRAISEPHRSLPNLGGSEGKKVSGILSSHVLVLCREGKWGRKKCWRIPKRLSSLLQMFLISPDGGGGVLLGQGCLRALFWRSFYFLLKWV